MARVLVVDDEESLRLVLRTLLKKHGYDVEVATSGEEALGKITTSPPDFVITDVRMGGMDGITLVKEIRKAGLETVVIVMSAYGSIDLAIEAMQAGAYDYVAKPFRQDEVLLTLKKAEEREELRRENKALREAARDQARFEEMLGQSEEMRRVFRKIGRAHV
jgi:two-component system response regulator AtoC